MKSKIIRLLSAPICVAILLACILSLDSFGQTVGSVPYKSQEVSEIDGIPVLIKHLPEWEKAYSQAKFATNRTDLKAALGERPILDVVDFSAGTEAVTAPYDAGKLLIIEYSNPQGSVDADAKFVGAIAENNDGVTYYRRIGNYNVLVFDATSRSAAENLIDEVKYEKEIHWLGDNPFRISAERAFVLTTADLFLSTVKFIVAGVGVSILSGICIGFFFYFFRESRRSRMTAYTDAGGMTRLNLDGFTPENLPERLLKD